MTSRFTQSVRASVAVLVLSASMTPSNSGAMQPRQDCASTPSRSSGPNANCYPGAAGTICPDDRMAAQRATTGQQQMCRGDRPCSCPGSSGTSDGDSNATQTDNGKHPSHEHQEGQGGDGGGLLPWLIIGGGLIAGAIVAADGLTGNDWAGPAELDANGPRFPFEQKEGRFQVQGYAVGGWPFAADLQTEPGTWTWLEIRYKGQDKPTTIDLTHPEGGRRVEFVLLPGVPGSVGIARYTLHSALIRANNKRLYRPMKVYGIGAGPNAAGALDTAQRTTRRSLVRLAAQPSFDYSAPLLWSASSSAKAPPLFSELTFGAAVQPQPARRMGSYLSVVSFGPAYPARPADVNWAVAALKPFQRSQLEVLRLPREGKGKLVAVERATLDLFAQTRASGSWGGAPTLANISRGTYLLQARAWGTQTGAKDWTGAFAPDYVYIR